MRNLETGNLGMEIENDSTDEIGDLINGYNSMTKRLDATINEVYRSKIKEKEYEMRALQAQINPHFLYNSLSIINWKALEADQEDISRITLSLSTFYRTALNKERISCLSGMRSRISKHIWISSLRCTMTVSMLSMISMIPF